MSSIVSSTQQVSVAEHVRRQHHGARQVPHAARRWCRLVMTVLGLPEDPRTLDAWARTNGISRGTLKTWCMAAGVSAKSSLDFARLLRCVIQSRGDKWDAFNRLNIVDPRTVDRLFGRAGFSESTDIPDARSFLESQRLVTSEMLLSTLFADLAPLVCLPAKNRAPLISQSSLTASPSIRHSSCCRIMK
jgi:hypothetical protein